MRRRACGKHRKRGRRGGILFEVLLAIALFAGAGSVVLGITGSAISRQDLNTRRQQALDLARSLMASLEAGLTTVADIRDGMPRELGSISDYGERMTDRMDQGLPGWSTSIVTQRTEFAGLSLVEITVREDLPGSDRVSLRDGAQAGTDEPISVTVRQLVRLREEDPEAWEVDEMIEDLPSADSSGGQP